MPILSKEAIGKILELPLFESDKILVLKIIESHEILRDLVEGLQEYVSTLEKKEGEGGL